MKSRELDDTDEARDAIARLEDADSTQRIVKEILGDDF